MNIPEILNRTAFAFSPLFMTDEEGRQLLVLITRATFTIGPRQLTVAEQQLSINPAGVFWGVPGQSSYKYEADFAFVKPATDIVLVGSAYAQSIGTTVQDVSVRVGTIQKTLRVFGDRYWEKGLLGIRMTSPEPFECMPLQFERAFGGWDRSDPDVAQHSFEPRNPMGVGFHAKGATIQTGSKLPNLEDPRDLIGDCYDCPPPAGFGFTAPDWQPRAQWAGTYDARWHQERMPLLPKDFDRRFFNAAAPGLQASGFLKGDEPVMLQGVIPEGHVQFNLPAIEPVSYGVRLRNKEPNTLSSKLDTVVINSDEKCVYLTWRASLPLPHGAQDVLEIEVSA